MKAGKVGIKHKLKLTKMRNWTKYLLVLIFPFLGSCYDDYIHDYEYTTIYIPYQVDVRTFVVGEGMKIKFGAELGGVRNNTDTRKAVFKIDPDLISNKTLQDMKGSSYPYIKNEMALIDTLRLMPASFYKLSHDNTIEILPGNHTGTIEIKADSSAFLSEPGTIKAQYAIPFSLTNVDADRLLEDKKSTVIALKFENMLYGNYLHGGVTTVKDPGGNVLKKIVYNTFVSQSANEIWSLVTSGYNSLTVQRYSNVNSTKNEIKLQLEGNNILVGSAEGSTYQFEADGQSSFNGVRNLQQRKILLNYKFTDNEGNTHHAQDTLTFRNRIRDGVNEWQGQGQ